MNMLNHDTRFSGGERIEPIEIILFTAQHSTAWDGMVWMANILSTQYVMYARHS